MKTFREFQEGYRGAKKDASLLARYKDLNNPKAPPDPLKPPIKLAN